MASPEEVAAEALVDAALGGERSAFAELTTALWPLARAAAKRSARGAEAKDLAQDLFAGLLEKLEADDHRALRTFVDWKRRHPEKGFFDWVRIVSANLLRDLHRTRSGRRSPSATDHPRAKRLLNDIALLSPLEDLSYRPRITSAVAAREILAFATQFLPALQASALVGWIEGESFADLKARTGIDSEEAAVRLVRAAMATLRRRFADAPGE